jgi:hypothetical protein
MIPVSAEAQELLESGNYVVRTFVSMYPDEGGVHLWDDWQPISVGGIQYLPMGDKATGSGVKSGSDFSAEGFTLTFDANGIEQSNSIANELVSSTWHQRPIVITTRLFDPGTAALALEIPVFNGDMDKVERTEGDESQPVLRLMCESIMRRMERRTLHTRTSVSQNLFFSLDRFFDYVETVSASSIGWGKEKTDLSPSGGSSIRPQSGFVGIRF